MTEKKIYIYININIFEIYFFIYFFILFIYLFIYFFIIIFRYAIAYLRTGSYAPVQFDIFKGKRCENCSDVLLRLLGVKLKCNLIKSDFQHIRFFFLFLSISVKRVNLRLV